jgi:hypothetical protein
MSKKRGLSLDEKRKRMLDIFYESKDFYLLKELEKIAPKQKGIISQSVKDVLQSLVDDNLVDTDKVGTSSFYWAFPSKALASRQSRMSELNDKLAALVAKNADLDTKITEVTSGREDSDDRTALLEELTTLEAKRSLLRSQVKRYEGCDPEVLERLGDETKLAKESANRWTDNIYSVHSWIGKKFPSINVSDLNKQFNIPEDLDYVE